jgi:tRNA A-37 threonylcarbamoyl transferase component Bud32
METHRERLRQISLDRPMPSGTVIQMTGEMAEENDWSDTKRAALEIVKTFDPNEMTSNKLKKELKQTRSGEDVSVGGTYKSIMTDSNNKLLPPGVIVFHFKDNIEEAIKETHVANFFYRDCSNGLANDVQREVNDIKTSFLCSVKSHEDGNVQHHYIDSNLIASRTRQEEIDADAANLLAKLQKLLAEGGKIMIHLIMKRLYPLKEVKVKQKTSLSNIKFEACEAIMKSAHAQGIVHCDLKTDNLCCIEVDGEYHVVPIDFGFVQYKDTESEFTLYPWKNEETGKFYAHSLGSLCPFDIKKALEEQGAGLSWDVIRHEDKIEIAKVYDIACLYVIKYDLMTVEQENASKLNSLERNVPFAEVMCYPQNYQRFTAQLSQILQHFKPNVQAAMRSIFHLDTENLKNLLAMGSACTAVLQADSTAHKPIGDLDLGKSPIEEMEMHYTWSGDKYEFKIKDGSGFYASTDDVKIRQMLMNFLPAGIS